MRWYQILEGRLETLQQQLVVKKSKLKDLLNHGDDSLVRRPSLDDDNETWERKTKTRDKLRRSIAKQAEDLGHEIELLKNEIFREKNAGKPSAMFGTVSSSKNQYAREYTDELGKAIHIADVNLPSPAAEAISAFVGVGADDHDSSGGVWDFKELDDAFSDSPSERGQLIADQLKTAFNPIKADLKKRFGDTIELYRSQMKLSGGESHRHVLSWTGNLDFANFHGRDSDDELKTMSFDIDDIVWITNRANQAEFIMRNHK